MPKLRTRLAMILAAPGLLLLSACAHPLPGAAPTDGDLLATTERTEAIQTFRMAIRDAQLDALLQGEGPLTIFAPTDAAFSKVPTKTLLALLSDAEIFTSVMMQHVVVGELRSSDFELPLHAATLRGGSVTVEPGVVPRVNGARVVRADIPASNGLIHLIDTVLLPPL